MGDRTPEKGSAWVLWCVTGAYIEEAASFIREIVAAMGGKGLEPVMPSEVVEEARAVRRDSCSLTSVEALLVLAEGTDSERKFR